MPRLPWTAAVPLLALGLAAPGCGSAEAAAAPGTAGGSVPAVAEADFAQAYATATCDAIAACCAAASIAFGRDRCLASALAEAQARVAARKDGVAYDPVSAGKCVALLSVAVTTCDLADDARARLDGACNEPFQGAGGACHAACFPAGALASAASCGAP